MASASSSWSRDHRRKKDEEDKFSAEADESMASVMAKLGSWTSDRVNTSTGGVAVPHYPMASPRYQYGGDGETEWMKSVLEREDDDDGDDVGGVADHHHHDDMVQSPYVNHRAGRLTMPETPGYQPSTPVASSRGMERADTPVMSNSKGAPDEDDAGTGLLHRRYSSRSSFQAAAASALTDKTPSPNVHTPAPKSVASRAPLSMNRLRGTTATPRRTTAPTQLSMEARQQVQTCQRYHDVLLQYLQSKRRWVERKELASSSTAMVTVDDTTGTADATLDSIHNEDKRIQVTFLQGLCALCYDDHASRDGAESPPSREGNFWNLLAHLRSIGMGSLLWQGNANVQQIAELEQLQQSFDNGTTPLEMMEALRQYSSETQNSNYQSVSVIQRRYQLIAWLEDCFRQQLPFPLHTTSENTNARANPNVEYKLHSELYQTQGLTETVKDSVLLRQALALIMAGRLENAQDLMRSNGLSWRAAVMGGGKPFGYQKTSSLQGLESKAVGNPNRPLWQCMLWRQVQESKRNSTHEEMAISALLCNNVKGSFANPCLRTWEKALFAGVKAMVGRTEDALLYQQSTMTNNKFARTHLENTLDMAGMDEERLLETLASTPYPEMAMQDDDPFADATAAFMIGQVAVKALLQGMQPTLDSGNSVTLRFVTHLILYLDSTKADSTGSFATASIRWELDKIRDPVVVKYIQSLAARELWNLLVLYASMLPSQTMLQQLPPLLAPVTNPNDRAIIVKQLRELQPGHELDVLRAVVQIQQDQSLQSIQDVDDSRLEIMQGGESDNKIMKALGWFCVLDDHALEAIIYSNTVIRRFILQDKLDLVFHFVENVRPSTIIEYAEKNLEDDDEEMPDQVEIQRRTSAFSELYAYESYLRAEQGVVEWHKEMDQTAVASQSLQRLTTDSNMASWNEDERAIAINDERRQLVNKARELAADVVGAARSARKALVDVLEHPSGWLWQEDGDTVSRAGGSGRDAEMLALRNQVLPHIAILHCEVCQETAQWMLRILQDIVVHHGGEVKSIEIALVLLDPAVAQSSNAEERASTIKQSPFSPTYWSTHALELSETLASDTFSVPVNEQVLEQMAKLAVSHLQFSSDLQQEPGL